MAEQVPTIQKSGLEKENKIEARKTKTPLSDPLNNIHGRVMLWQSACQNMNSMASLRQARTLLI
jgi:hypothetical protein